MGEWRNLKLSDLCSSVDYGYTASANSNSQNPKFLRITDIVPGYINWDSVPHCDIDSKNYERNKLSHDDIVIARTGATTGYSCYINTPPAAVFASYLVRLKINNLNHARFVAYYLKSSQFFNYLNGVLGDKSAQPNASASTLVNAPINVPSYTKQEKIASILSSLDDKIELNRKMNETLEEMARAIFKSWFVDFDPVHAKARGEKPAGMPDEIADLFPSEFVHSDQLNKPIPKGWEVKPISKTYDVTIGKTPPRKEFQWFNQSTQSCKWVSIRDLGNSNAFIFETNETLTDEAVKKFNIKILPVGTVILSFKLTLGRVAITTESMCTNEAIAHFQCKNNFKNTYFLYNYLTLFNYSLLGSTSSIATAVNSKIIRNMPFLQPTQELVDEYEKYVAEIFNKIHSLEKETAILIELRDSLLPKLVSGEIEV